VDQGQSHPGQGVLAHILAFACEQPLELLGLIKAGVCPTKYSCRMQSTYHVEAHAAVRRQYKCIIAWQRASRPAVSFAAIACP